MPNLGLSEKKQCLTIKKSVNVGYGIKRTSEKNHTVTLVDIEIALEKI